MTPEEQILSFVPGNAQEQADKQELLRWLREAPDVFSRENRAGHFTASGWVVSPDRRKVLMVYHNLYNSWSWMGGHADGDRDLCRVAEKEIREESGISGLKLLDPNIFSLEVLTVDGHIKRGEYVPSHLHLNVTYLFEADTDDTLSMKPDENSGVQWIDVEKLPEMVSEPWFMTWVYSKLCEKVRKTSI